MKFKEIATPLGQMVAIGDDRLLYVLEFCHQERVSRQLKKLEALALEPESGESASILSIESELRAYFSKTLRTFHTPYDLLGTPFQKEVWSALSRIPFGMTISYFEQANALQRPHAYRAVANANGANHLAILVPCHRVIAKNGSLGGYAAGILRKQSLLQHEKSALFSSRSL